MITVNSQPDEFVLVRNPVNYELQTDNYISTAGSKANCSILFTSSTNSGTVTFTFLGKTIIFTQATTPDDSGLQYKEVGATQLDFDTTFIDALEKNYDINQNYDVTRVSAGLIRLTAKLTGTKYNIGIATTVTGTTLATTAGVNTVYRERFKILHDVFFENTFGSDVFTQLFAGSGIPNEANKVAYNFSDVLRGALQLFIPPFAAFTFNLNTTVKRFYTRYCESYGFPTVTNAYKKTNVKFGLLGARTFVNASIDNFLADYFTATPYKFLNTSPNNTVVDRVQKQYLSIYIATPATYNFRITFTYTDLTTSNANGANMVISDAGFYTFETGYAALGMDALKTSGKTVLKYTIRLKDAASWLSETKTYCVDNNYQLFPRYFLFFNSFGMPETMYFTGKQTNQVQSKNEIIRKADYGFDVANGIFEGETAEINNELQFGYELNSGWKTKEWLTFFNDFLNSRKRFIQGSDKWIGVNIPAQKIQLQEDDNTLYSVKFNYQDSFIEKGNA